MLYQASELHRMAAASQGALVVIETRTDLERLLARRAGGADVVGGLLDIEGAHAIGDDPAQPLELVPVRLEREPLGDADGGRFGGVGRLNVFEGRLTLVDQQYQRGICLQQKRP